MNPRLPPALPETTTGWVPLSAGVMFGGTVNSWLPDLYDDSDSADDAMVDPCAEEAGRLWTTDRIDDEHFSPGKTGGGDNGWEKARAFPAATTASAPGPPPLSVYAAAPAVLAISNLALAGSVLLAGFGAARYGLSPLWHTGARDLAVVLGLLVVAVWPGRRQPLRGVLRNDRPRLGVIAASFGLGSVLCSLGLSRSNSLTAVAWAPAGSLFCVLLAGGLGLERISRTQLSGLSLAISGALFVILYSAAAGQEGSDGQTAGAFHALLCFGTVLVSTALVFSPPLLHRYGAAAVLFWGSLLSTLLHVALLGSILALDGGGDSLLDGFCGAASVPACRSWAFPRPTLYYVLASAGLQVLAWLSLLAAGCRYLPSAHVGAGFTVQPAGFLALAALVRHVTGEPIEGLPRGGGLAQLGAIGVALGLVVVVWDRYRRDRERRLHHLAQEFLLTKE